MTFHGSGGGAIVFNGVFSSDPCTNAGSSSIGSNGIFFNNAGTICICNNLGVAKKCDSTTACPF